MTHKYEPLETYLRATPPKVREVTVSFRELQSILGAPLPASAYTYREWWSNQRDTKSRPQAHAWGSAGFAVDAVNQSRSNGWVRFKRKH